MRIFTLIALILFTMAGCGSEFSTQVASHENAVQDVEVDPPAPSTPPQPAPPPTPPDEQVLGAVAWDNPKKNSRDWSLHVYQMILDKKLSLLRGANDIATFCPQFNILSEEQRAYFWTAFVAAFAYYESGWDPTARMVETTMGTDPVTGKQVASEGLLQLSYQDGRNHSYCNEFDWSADRKLSARDPRKTILDPFKNLSCGVQILNRQIERYGKILIDKGAYWAVLKPHRKDRISGIQKQLKPLTFCQP